MSNMFYSVFGDFVLNQTEEHFFNTNNPDNIEHFSNEKKSEESEEQQTPVEEEEEKLPSMKNQDFLSLDGNLVLDGVVKASDFIKSDGSEVKEVPILKTNYILPKDIKYTAGGKLETIELKSKNVKSDKIELAGPLHLYDKVTKGDDSDPYRIEKIRSGANNNQLRFVLHDDPNESLGIWGNSCANGKCADDNKAREAHKFDVQGNATHKGDVSAKKVKVAGPIHLFDKVTKGDDSDPYRIEKVRSGANNNQLRFILHDDPNESLGIWGNSCANGKCGDDNKAREAHRFDVRGNASHKGDISAQRVMVSGPIHLFDKVTKGNDSDAYRIEKVRISPNNNQLRFILHDDPNESLSIWGNSCANGRCNDDRRAKEAHKFDVQGNATHQGTVKCKKLCIGKVCLEEKNGELVLENNLRLKKNLNVEGKSWNHGVSNFKKQNSTKWSTINSSDGNTYFAGNVKAYGSGKFTKGFYTPGRYTYRSNVARHGDDIKGFERMSVSVPQAKAMCDSMPHCGGILRYRDGKKWLKTRRAGEEAKRNRWSQKSRNWSFFIKQ